MTQTLGWARNVEVIVNDNVTDGDTFWCAKRAGSVVGYYGSTFYRSDVQLFFFSSYAGLVGEKHFKKRCVRAFVFYYRTAFSP